MPLMVRRGAGFLSFSATGPRVGTGLGQVAPVLSCATPSAGASNAAPSRAAVNVIMRCSIGAPSNGLGPRSAHSTRSGYRVRLIERDGNGHGLAHDAAGMPG